MVLLRHPLTEQTSDWLNEPVSDDAPWFVSACVVATGLRLR
jgi:hypothetical protein